jgi:ketosteroid isomerase-like protein
MTQHNDAVDLRDTLTRFVDAFNRNDLDSVMSFFAEDAVFSLARGKTHRGKAAIRKAFEPQFRGVLGEMSFAVHDWVVDEAAGKATICWVCHHDIGGDRGRGVPLPLRVVARALLGQRAAWQGLDVFHFDARGRIVAKHSYTNGRPKLSRQPAKRG